MRSSRETELTERFPVHVVTAWLGNTPEIARRHYLQTTDEHYLQALEPDPAAQRAANALQKVAAQSRKPASDGGNATAWGPEPEAEAQSPNSGTSESLREPSALCAAHVSPCYEMTSGEGGIRTLGPG